MPTVVCSASSGVRAAVSFTFLLFVASGACRLDEVAVPGVGVPADADTRPGDGNSDAPFMAMEDAPAAPTTQKPLGSACLASDDCASRFCVDGVCCNSACQDGCSACDVPGRVGTCAFIPDGEKPRATNACPAGPPETCGLDGTCDGNGRCRKHGASTACAPGKCEGGSVVGAGRCDGQGACKRDSTLNCAPFGCDPGSGETGARCRDTCSTDAMCAPGQRCQNGSCGQRPRGMPCTSASECASGFCADGVCCDSACTGSCLACDQPGEKGRCLPVKAGLPDPRKLCRDEGPARCGQTGTCDGTGACARYPTGTVCKAGSCDGNAWVPESTCDGNGACMPGSAVDCFPMSCGSGGCLERCTRDQDCLNGKPCVNGLCDLKNQGQPCKGGNECRSGFCADGVCCNEACTDACRSCALATKRGTCSAVPANTLDPRGKCTDQGPASCGSSGTCAADGTCARYAAGTVCKGESCAGGVYKSPSRCDGNGRCVAGTSQTCAPYVCNGARCFDSCGNDAACVDETACVSGSCGKKSNGASCSNAGECQSGYCAQGVCCDGACTGACRSCNQPQAMGKCTSLPAGAADTTGVCKDGGAASCGNDGTCDGKGACRKYGAGVVCKNATCPASGDTFMAASVCDGKGSCVAGSAQSCAPFKCDGTACRTRCRNDADCSNGQSCNAGACGKRPLGVSCTAAADCASGHCVDGACCESNACGPCRSCNLSGQAGKCAPIAADQPDPLGRCPRTAGAPCGNTGQCDGAGSCAKAPPTTQCSAGGCMGSTRVGPGFCDGNGACRPGQSESCAPYVCDGDGTCRVSCEKSEHCADGKPCRLNGKKKNTCAGSGDD